MSMASEMTIQTAIQVFFAVSALANIAMARWCANRLRHDREVIHLLAAIFAATVSITLGVLK